MNITKQIESIQFGVLSKEEILKMSVVEVNNSKFPGVNSIYDARMGPINSGDSCVTCEQKTHECPGHFGHIVLNENIIHPLYTKNSLSFLKCLCMKCSRLLVSEDNIRLWKLMKLQGQTRFEQIVSRCEKLHFCIHCKLIQPKFTFSPSESMYYGAYKTKEGIEKNPISIHQIKKIFERVSDKDIELLGFDPQNSRPINLIIQVLPVLPPCARPYIVSNNVVCDDDLTLSYCEIIKINNNLADKELTEIKRNKYIQNLIFRVKTLFDNSAGKAKHTNMRQMKGIKERLCGRDGIVRSNLMGKRVDFSARTVIGGDPTLRVNEIAIPYEMAETLTYPENVNQINIKDLQKLVDTDKVNVVIRNGSNYRLKYVKERFVVRIGDVVERQLRDGDIVLLNRQPTLHLGSMLAMRVKIRPGKTIRMNLAITSTFNADEC